MAGGTAQYHWEQQQKAKQAAAAAPAADYPRFGPAGSQFGSNFPDSKVPGSLDDLALFLGQNPSLGDLIMRQEPWNVAGAKPSEAYGGLGVHQAFGLGQAGEMASPLAFGNLIQILLRQGKTDPAQMNQQIAGIGRDTSQAQTNLQGDLARMGQSRSGVGQAINAAVGAQGRQQGAQLRADDAAASQQRLMQALGMYQQLIQNPSLDLASIGSGITAQNQARRQQKDAANQNFWGQVFGTAADVVSG